MTEVRQEINKDSSLSGGKYIFTYEISVLPDLFAGILSAVSGLVDTTYNVLNDKEISIDKIQRIEGTNKVEIYISVLKNPIPVLAILGVIAGLLGVFGAYLVLSKVEQIISEPVVNIGGIGLNFGAIILVCVGIYLYTIWK